MAMFAFSLGSNEVDNDGVLSVSRQIVLPVQDTSRASWEIVGIDYQAELLDPNLALVPGWTSSSVEENGIQLNAGLFMSDQGTPLDGNGDARDIDFSLANPTLIDSWASELAFVSPVKKISF